MKYVNKVILVGNVVNDPERKSPEGQPSRVCFRLATNRDWKDSKGMQHSLPEYHQILAWGGLADHIMAIVKRAKLMYIEGYLKTHVKETGGVKSFHTEVIAESIIVLTPSGEAAAVA